MIGSVTIVNFLVLIIRLFNATTIESYKNFLEAVVRIGRGAKILDIGRFGRSFLLV